MAKVFSTDKVHLDIVGHRCVFDKLSNDHLGGAVKMNDESRIVGAPRVKRPHPSKRIRIFYKKICIWYLILVLLINVTLTSAQFEKSQGGSYAYDYGDWILIGNNFIEIKFDKKDKGGIAQIKNKLSDVSFLPEFKKGPHVLFYISPSGTHTFMAIDFSYKIMSTPGGKILIMTWNGFRGGDNVPRERLLDIHVKASITILDNSPLTYWRIEATSSEYDIDINSITFPIISGLTYIGDNGEDDFLVYPSLTGLLMRNPWKNLPVQPGIPWQLYPSGWVSMQFMAFYNIHLGGLYLATNDTEGNVKGFSVYRFSMNDWNMAVTHYQPYGEKSLNLTYSVIVGVFLGDWHVAAEIYKSWAENQWWCVEALKRSTPSWFLETSAIHSTSLYTPGSEGWASQIPFYTVPLLAEDSIKTLGMPVIMQVWGWEKHGTFTLIPDYFPPIEGWDAFDSMIDGVHRAGGKVSVFISTNYFSPELEAYKEMRKYAIKLKDRTLEGLMCPASTEWRSYVKEIALTLVRHGVDHVHLDGSLIDPPYPCVHENHNHPKGYGKWWFEAFKELFKEIREEAKKINPEVVFSSEEICELYIPFLDRFYSRGNVAELYATHWFWQITGSEAIPLFQYVYHKYISSWGHYVHGWSMSSSEISYSIKALATSLVWGEPLEIRLPSLGERMSKLIKINPIVLFFKRATTFRYNIAKDFLVYGEMITPLNFTAPVIRIKNPSWHLSPTELKETVTPAILHSAWKNSMGEIGFVFVNIGDESVEIKLRIDPSKYNLTQAFVIEERLGGARFVGKASNDFITNITLNPNDIILLRLTERRVPVYLSTQPGGMVLVVNKSSISLLNPTLLILERNKFYEFQAQMILNLDQGTRYKFERWIIEGERHGWEHIAANLSLKLDSPINLTALYSKEFHVNASTPYGSINGTGWYKAGSLASLTIPVPEFLVGNGTRVVFEGWYEDGNLLSNETRLELKVDSPKNVEARWKKQYYVSIETNIGQISGAGWYDYGSVAAIRLIAPKIQGDPLVRYVIDRVEGITKEDEFLNMSLILLKVDRPRNLRVFWKIDYTGLFSLISLITLITILITIATIIAFRYSSRKK
ncbi:DUF6259 domain-containing protein [Infirmifilum sp.]|uniref:DUF6259 domain-containing protein n=1 Tax=Infirmifilum sp. TaxID=2856575 RepID=UPI003D0FFE1A